MFQGFNPEEIKLIIKNNAKHFGITKIAIAKPEIRKEHFLFKEWLDMNVSTPFLSYLKKNAEIRMNIKDYVQWVESIIVCAVYYNSKFPLSIDVNNRKRGWISRYAWGEDYHRVIRGRLLNFVRFLKEKLKEPPPRFKICVDTSPVTEKIYGQACGLGWIGKNTILINPEIGSFFFLGLILTDIDIPSDREGEKNCGSCSLCIDACPTSAISSEGFLDARKCIAHLNNDYKAEIPFKISLANNLFGCDICQDVCPLNKSVNLNGEKVFEPVEENFYPFIDEILKLNEEDFLKRFGKTPIKKRGLPFLKYTAELIKKTKHIIK